MASWELLDEKGESDLHKTRLLNVEEKPFKRITKRLAAISAIAWAATTKASHNHSNSNSSISNSSSGGGVSTSTSNGHGHGHGHGHSAALQEDLTLDFAAFDSSIARLQFLHDANVRERARYESDKQRILAECQAARDANALLREQLEGARRTLAQRRRFDELAERILANRMLRPREDQAAALAKLEDECRELERESQTYSGTWRERRDQFNRIMEEGMLLRRQIRDEKEEVDRREGMVDEDAAEDEAGGAAAAAAAAAAAGGGGAGGSAGGSGSGAAGAGTRVATPGPDPSLAGTPRPVEELARHAADAAIMNPGTGTATGASSTAATTTPLLQTNGRGGTPARADSLGPESSLKVPTAGLAAGSTPSVLSQSGSRASTREPSAPPPPPQQQQQSSLHGETPGAEEDEDVQMGDGAKEEPRDTRSGDKMEVDT